MSKQESKKIMNTKTNCEDSNQTDALADLPVTDEQAEQAKGGDSSNPNLTASTGWFRY
jgi:hypothetical protein